MDVVEEADWREPSLGAVKRCDQDTEQDL